MTARLPKYGAILGTSADAKVRNLVNDTIRHCKHLSREQIAERMTERLGQRVTVRMLYDYTSKKRKYHRFPACFVIALCEVTGDERLRAYLGAPYFEFGKHCAEVIKRHGR